MRTNFDNKSKQRSAVSKKNEFVGSVFSRI